MTAIKVEVIMSNYRALSIVVIMFSWIISFSASSTQSTLSVTGTITFSGAIVDTPCDTSVLNQTITTSCYRNGKMITSRQTLTRNMPLNARLPGSLATSRLEWLNQQRSLGVLTVTYL
ncbi:putative membrane protein [Yersinia pestis]|nr:putative membrane protein [Yersinia pestis]